MGASIDVRDLARAAAAGDQHGWDGLVERFGELVWSTIRAYGLSPGDGADAAQTTWLLLAEQLGHLEAQHERLGVWLAATARRESLRLLGAARIATAAPTGPDAAQPVGQPLTFLQAALFQWVNPKSWLVSASAAGAFLSAEAGSPVLQAASLGGLFVLAALPSCFMWLAFGAAVQRVLHGRRSLRIFNIVMGALLALSIALIVR